MSDIPFKRAIFSKTKVYLKDTSLAYYKCAARSDSAAHYPSMKQMLFVNKTTLTC